MTSDDRGRLIALEGIDGSGKSTQAALLAERLGAVLTHEPGATALGVALRKVLLEPSEAALSARAEALLMVADRAQHVDEVLSPALSSGKWVVTDRFSASTVAYQGFGRLLDVPMLEGLVGWAANGIQADLTVLVDVPVDVALARRVGDSPDRLEGLDRSFHERVRAGYLELAGAHPDRWVVVDGSTDADVVAESIGDAVKYRLGDPRP